MTEHEASTVADESATDQAATDQAATDQATTDQPSTDQAGTDQAATEAESNPGGKRRGRKSTTEGGEHPSLFAINLADPELPCSSTPFELRVEASILLADRPISEARIAEVLGLVPASTRMPGKGASAGDDSDAGDGEGGSRDSSALAARRREAIRLVREAIDTLNRQYAESNRTFRIESVSGGRQMLTIATFGPILSRMKGQRAQTRLSQAALETLAIVAYRQPILRAQLEAIRGVACGEVLKSLMERRLVKIVGRAEEVGRPMLYGTTPEFLRVFGIANLSDLPQAKDLK
ncbi:MAG: segregation and condensation protein [Planctomycetota bacterium]